MNSDFLQFSNNIYPVLHSVTDLVDLQTEGLIIQHLKELFEGKMIIIVSSKLSLVRQADRIIVMKDGEIVEDGSHLELVKNGGSYEALWNIHIGKTAVKRNTYPEGDIRNFISS